MAKPSTKGLLKEILSDDIEWVYVHITDKAIEWAVAGFIGEANKLLEQLWKFNIPHSEHLWIPDEGLQIMWQISNKLPNNIPFQFKEVSEIETENWSRNFYPSWHESYTNSFIKKSIDELEGQELFVKAITAISDKSESTDKILEALKRYLEMDTPVGYSYFHATTCASLIAARQKNGEFTEHFIQLWGKGYLNYWNNYSLAYLMRDRKCAEYLLNGTLAPVFKLTHEIILKETEEIIEALSNRMSSGRTLVYKKLSWKQLLDKISKIAIKQNTIDFSEDILVKKSLSKLPATKEEINTAEKRLNIALPDDYKKFLLTSNGLENFSYTGVTLAAVEKVDFLIKVDEQLVDIWANSMDDIDTTFGDKLRSSIIIGGHEEEQQLLLIPLQNKKWECWHFSSWRPGEVVYESFRFYMEGELQSLEDNIHLD
jgi:SMI1 / KNR4 family (SUKH-1)